MSTWVDIFSLVATLSIVGGAVYVVIYIVGAINQGVKSTKDSLKEKGYEISGSGVAVKTQKHFNREDYFDATQRGIVRAVNASSFRKNASESPSSSNTPSGLNSPPAMERSTSSGSGSSRTKKGLKIFGGKKKD